MYLLLDVTFQINLKHHSFPHTCLFFLCCDLKSSLALEVCRSILEYTLYVLHLAPTLYKTAPRIRNSMPNYKVSSFSNSEITITAQQPNNIKSLHKRKAKYTRKKFKATLTATTPDFHHLLRTSAFKTPMEALTGGESHQTYHTAYKF